MNARDWFIDRIINRVKERSSKFIRKWCPDFDWQETYAAVTISRSEDEIEKDYIRRQKDIHKTLDYKDEFRKLLDDHCIEYVEKDLWE